jgi:hypothetical protein
MRPNLTGYGMVNCADTPNAPECKVELVNTKSPYYIAYSALSTAGAVSGAYHGYRRNDSVGWAIGWFLLGGIFPFITIPVSLAQGYGKPHSRRVDI